MRTKHLCVLVHIRTKGEVGTFKNNFLTDCSKAVLLLWILLDICVSCLSLPYCLSVPCCLVVTCWERAELLVLLCVIYCFFLSISIWCPGSGVQWSLIVLTPDLCLLPYFKNFLVSYKNRIFKQP